MTVHGGPVVLVVDDDEDTAELLSEGLRRRGYAADAVRSAVACLEHLQSHPVDIVVSDVQMPGMSGVELCRLLTASHPDVRAIVLTGVADLGTAVAAIRAGAYAFVTKPARLATLDNAIKRALDSLAATREAKRLRPPVGTVS